MNKFLQLLETIFLIQSISSNVIMDSTSMDSTITFRKNRCFETAEEQETYFYKMAGYPYKKFQRPMPYDEYNMTSPTYINVSLDMNSLASVDDMNSEYSLTLKMDLEWFDHRLKFDCNDEHVLLSVEPFQHERIWTPKLGVPNVKEPGSLEMNGPANVVSFKIRSDGYVFIRSRVQLKLFCQLNFMNYPFDEQECSVILESRGIASDQMVLQWRENNPFRNVDRFRTFGFTLIGYELYNDSVQIIDLFEEDSVSRIKAVLHLQREWYHFLLDIYLPSVIFVTMSWLSFWLEISAAPARVTLGMTTMLTLVTCFMSAREKLPKVSYIHVMDIWIAFCICFVFASLIEFALVSYLYRSEKNRQHRRQGLHRNISELNLSSFISASDPLNSVSKYLDLPERPISKDSLMVPNAGYLRRSSSESNTTSTTCSLRNLTDCSIKRKESFVRNMFRVKCPDQLADTIDRRCRLMFPLCFALFNIIYWTSVKSM